MLQLPRLPLNRPVGTLHITAEAMAAIMAEGWRRFPLETGGVLLGTQQGRSTNV